MGAAVHVPPVAGAAPAEAAVVAQASKNAARRSRPGIRDDSDAEGNADANEGRISLCKAK